MYFNNYFEELLKELMKNLFINVKQRNVTFNSSWQIFKQMISFLFAPFSHLQNRNNIST